MYVKFPAFPCAKKVQTSLFQGGIKQKRKHRAPEGVSMFSGGEKTLWLYRQPGIKNFSAGKNLSLKASGTALHIRINVSQIFKKAKL